MSKIIEYLEKIGSVTPTPIGFGTSKPADKFPQIALAALADVNSLNKKQANDFDFIVVRTQKTTKTSQFKLIQTKQNKQKKQPYEVSQKSQHKR